MLQEAERLGDTFARGDAGRCVTWHWQMPLPSVPARPPGSQYERGSLYRLLFWYDYAPEGVCMHQGCSSDAGDFKRYVSCLVPARQRLENVERTLPQWKRHPMPGGGAPVVRSCRPRRSTMGNDLWFVAGDERAVQGKLALHAAQVVTLPFKVPADRTSSAISSTIWSPSEVALQSKAQPSSASGILPACGRNGSRSVLVTRPVKAGPGKRHA